MQNSYMSEQDHEIRRVNLLLEIEQLLERKAYKEAIVRLELYSQLNMEIGLWLKQIPARLCAKSPMLMMLKGKEALWNGKLEEATLCLHKAIKGFADQGQYVAFLTAFAIMGQVKLRLGIKEDTDTILTMLKEEYTREGSACNGYVPWALARWNDGDSSQEASGYYQAAIQCFERDSDRTSWIEALWEYLLVFGSLQQSSDWQHYYVQLEQFVYREEKYSGYLHGLDALINEHQSKPSLESGKPAIQLSNSDNGAMSYQAANLALLYNIRSELQQGIEHSLEWLHRSSKRFVLNDIYIRAVWDYTIGYYHCVKNNNVEASLAVNKLKAGLPLLLCPPLSRLQDQPSNKQSHHNSMETTAKINSVNNASWRIHCFGGLSLNDADQEVKHIRWKRKKSQELFAYLLLQPDYAASKEKIEEDLFPEGDPVTMNNRIYVAIHQLRTVLKTYWGETPAIIVREGIIRLFDEHIQYVDVEKYTALIRIGDQLWQTDQPLSIELYEKAIQLYDELLPDVLYAEWLDLRRRYLVEKQAETLRRLEQYYRRSQDWERTLYYCKEWVALCPLQEEAHQQVIRTLLAMDRTSEARSWFGRWRQICREELAVEPLPETYLLLGELKE